MARSKRRVLLQRQNTLETQLAEIKRELSERDRDTATHRRIVLGRSILARASDDFGRARSEVEAILAGSMRPHDRRAFEDWSLPWDHATGVAVGRFRAGVAPAWGKHVYACAVAGRFERSGRPLCAPGGGTRFSPRKGASIPEFE